ncbi:transmembrane and coiled-coil domain-containing protein 4-like isoform X2 [Mytilus galloprovincialis]|uniref:transmembrane and coiled-coil domain-containing protein 4-like isoform X2 n=1 Tax=Mytilus galloprovincialis TaxID=29158 RepID=UPI003F7B502E
MSKHQMTDSNQEVVCLPSKLTDVGTFSYSCLCGVSLLQLFNDDWNREFKKAAIESILAHLRLPSQACESVKAITEGEGVDDPKPYADILLTESCLNGSGVPVVTDLVTFSLLTGRYDSRMRTLIKHVAWHLRVSWDHIEEIETVLAETLEAKQYEISEKRKREEETEKKKKSRNSKIKRYALIGIATVSGGALIGLTGGLAAPLVAAGASAIIGGAGAAALGTTAGVAIIGSLFGVAGAGLAGHKMRKRFGAIEEFSFEPMISGGALQRASMAKQLHVTIAVTGWLSHTMKDVKIPWKNLAESNEQYCLRYESKHLCILGDAFELFLSGAVSMATQEALKYTLLSGIISAIAWPATLISAANIIDNPWSVCLQRSVTVGKELAETLLAREQGNRPVTLIGYSLGARVIFHCLEEMAKRKCCEGIIEDVILLGAPVTGDAKSWKNLGKVVAGKIINGYSKADWLLKFLYRTSSVQFSVAGLQPIKWDDRRMHNIDLSAIVTGHGEYLKQLDTVMKVVGVRMKQDIVVRPLTSHTMMAGSKDNLESLTSSEEEEEESGKSSEKSKKKKSHKDKTQPENSTSSDATSSLQSDVNTHDEQVQTGIHQLQLDLPLDPEKFVMYTVNQSPVTDSNFNNNEKLETNSANDSPVSKQGMDPSSDKNNECLESEPTLKIQTLEPVNTFTSPVKPEPGNTGPIQQELVNTSQNQQELVNTSQNQATELSCTDDSDEIKVLPLDLDKNSSSGNDIIQEIDVNHIENNNL